MTLTAGTNLGPYRILVKIGSGGQGEVYKAWDTRLERWVAIKVLPAHLSSNPELKQRFEREARAVAALDHPPIVRIHDICQYDGVYFRVMEYLDGETLAARLEKGPLPLDQALQYGIEIADALDKAHRQGFTHRDCKSGNIMLVKSGSKLLDFGLAKFRPPVQSPPVNASDLPTRADLTADGRILGTLQYMAPEQLEGREADARTDIFAFGSVLYEMVTGRKAFEGESQASLIGAILKDNPPPLSTLQPMTPPALDHVLKRCLAKERDERWQTAGDLMRELKWIAEGSIQGISTASTAAATAPAPPAPIRMSRGWVLLAGLGGLLAGIIIAVVAVWNLKPSSPLPGSSAALTLTLSPGEQLLDQGRPAVALSPDGTQLAYIARRGTGPQQLYLRALDSLEPRPILGTEGARDPFFSPDGKWVGFYTNGALFKVSVEGRLPVKVADVPFAPRGLAWGPNDTIFLGGANIGLHWIDAQAAAPLEITHPDSKRGEQYHAWPEVLPDGKHVLFTSVTGESSDIGVLSLETRKWRILERTEGAGQPHYLDSGHLVFFRRDGLSAAPFNVSQMMLGSAIPVLDRLSKGFDSGLYLGYFAVSRSGSLIYVPGDIGGSESRLVRVDLEGREEALTAAPGRYRYGPFISPDGKRLVVGNNVRTSSDLWIHDLDRGTRTRLTSQDANISPVWSADSRRIIFADFKRGAPSFDIYWIPADGSGQPEPLLVRDYGQYPTSSSRDGRLLAFDEINPKGGGRDIYLLRLDGDHATSPFLTTPADEGEATFSPDNRFLAYASDESGRYEVYVRAISGEGGKSVISTDGGRWPRWSPKGNGLFFRNGDKMMVVEVASSPAFTAGKPRVLFESSYGNLYDVTPDGQRFLMIKANEQTSAATQINVVLNWFEELKRRVPVEKKQ